MGEVYGGEETDLAVAFAADDKVWNGVDVAEGEDGGHGGDGPVGAVFVGGGGVKGLGGGSSGMWRCNGVLLMGGGGGVFC